MAKAFPPYAVALLLLASKAIAARFPKDDLHENQLTHAEADEDPVFEAESNGPPCNGDPVQHDIRQTWRFSSNVPRFTSTPRGKTVIILADFDGCWDFLSKKALRTPEKRSRIMTYDPVKMRGRLGKVRKDFSDEFEKLIIKITDKAERVVLFSGSNRQSYPFDKMLQSDGAHSDELSQDFFELITKEQNWELNKALLADHGVYHYYEGDPRFDIENRSEIDFAATVSAGSGTYGSGWKNPDAFQPGGGTDGEDKLMKLLLVRNALWQLQCFSAEVPAEVFFFDDKKEYLDYVRENINVPDHIVFRTVHFDYMDPYDVMRGTHAAGFETFLKVEPGLD